MSLFKRVLGTFRAGRTRASIDEEVRFHLDQRSEELERNGAFPDEADRLARRRFGGVALASERTHDADTLVWLDSFLKDLGHAARSLRRAPGLVIVSVLSLGIGMGLNLALYSGVRTIFFHEPTMTNPEEVVGIEPGNGRLLSYPNYRDLERSGIFASVMGIRSGSMTRGTAGAFERVSVAIVTANFFEGLGIRAEVGRAFAPDEGDARRDPRLVVLAHDYWRARFGADPAIVGRTLTLNSEPFAVVGVLPRDFKAITGFVAPALYVPVSPLTLATLEDRGSPSLSLLARLRPQSTSAEARPAVAAWARELERLFPERNAGLGRRVLIFPGNDLQFRGTPIGFQIFPVVLGILFSLLLLLGAVNVAGLLLARATSRRHEIAIRVALGAGRGRVLQALLVESFLLSTIGTAAGLMLCVVFASVRLPASAEFLQMFIVADAQLLTPALLLMVVTTFLCGLVPAIRATRVHGVPSLRLEEAGGSERLRLRNGLVVSQVAVSLTLLVVASLCQRSQMRVFAMDLGFDLDHGIVGRLNFEPQRGRAAAEEVSVGDRVVERLEQLPGVRSASLTALVPLGGDALVASFHPAGRSDIPGTRPTTTSVGPRYFETLSIPVLQGRDFVSSDREGAPAVAIANKTFADTYFPGGRAIGQVVDIGGETDAEIVGVVGNNKMDTIGEAPKSVLYYPFAQRPRRLTVVARTTGDPALVLPAVRRAIEEVDPTTDARVTTLREAASSELAMRQTGTIFVGAVGLVGMLLAAVGLYGIVAYLVASRTVEIGIRLALGASPSQLYWAVMKHSARLVAVGVGIGTVAALAFTPALSTFLAGVSTIDPIAYLGAAAVLIATALVASFVPARRVTRVDPMTALKQN
jgi:putative ABC transport system permease protein